MSLTVCIGLGGSCVVCKFVCLCVCVRDYVVWHASLTVCTGLYSGSCVVCVCVSVCSVTLTVCTLCALHRVVWWVYVVCVCKCVCV